MATFKNTTINDTGSLQLPAGSTGQRPSGSPGELRFNTDTNLVEYYNDDYNTWFRVGFNPPIATGGTTTNINQGGVSYRVHTFTSNGTFTVNTAGEVEYLIVGGGGSGGVDSGGGGGAGGVLTGTKFVETGSYSIEVGTGGPQSNGNPGPGSPPNWGPGDDGTPSSALGLTALGGSGGYGWSATSNPPGNPNYVGASGGGQSSGGATPNPNGIGYGTAGQGHDGGSSPNGQWSGGGGGAGGPGFIGNPNIGGTGGTGIVLPISGSIEYYAGGGTGGWDVAGGQSVTQQSTNNDTSKNGNVQSPENAVPPANRGHGGHGANHNDQFSGAGSDGIVIIRYRTRTA